MKSKMQTHNTITVLAQQALKDFMDKKIGYNELSAVSKMCDSMTKTASVKLKYDTFQNDHTGIEYLEGK